MHGGVAAVYMIVRHTQTGPDTHGLTVGREYTVIGIEADDYRLLNDLGEPALFPPDAFEIVDRTRPAEWIATTGPDGEEYAYPAPLNTPGIFEDFFDHEPAAVAAFWQDVNRQLSFLRSSHWPLVESQQSASLKVAALRKNASA